MKRDERTRAFSQLPRWLYIGCVISVLAQSALHYISKVDSENNYQPLKPPATAELYRNISMGSDRLIAYLLILKVQLHDSQSGRHINYRYLDFNVLKKWLLTVSQINPGSEYPAFLASRVYSSVTDKGKIQVLIDVIQELFQQNPAIHWRRMTEATLLAKHQLKDLPQALKLAEQVSSIPKEFDLPFWARDMKLILMDELGEKESAIILISSMLQSGEIHDNDEKHFLQSRLLKIQQELSENKRN